MKLFMIIAVSLAMLTLNSCSGRNPIEPPIPHAEAGYSGSQKTMAAIAAFAGVFGPIAVMKENDSRAQMNIRVNWDCHRWGQFVEKVVLAIMEGRSEDAVLKDVHALNAIYQCVNCPQGMLRLKIVQNVYTSYAAHPSDLPTTASLPDVGKDVEKQCVDKLNTPKG